MKPLRTLVSLSMVVLLAGCVPSIHPLYTDEDLAFDPALLGSWEDSDEIWVFEELGESGYRLTITQDGRPAVEFEARLLQLGSHRFLDLYPEEPPLESDFLKWHLLPVHTFYKFHQEADAVRLVGLDGEWLEEVIDRGLVDIGHERVDDGVLLTAPTEDLQALVLAHVDDPDAFRDSGPEAPVIDLNRRRGVDSRDDQRP